MKKLKISKLDLRWKTIIVGSLAGLITVGSLAFVIIPSQASIREQHVTLTDLQLEQGASDISTTNYVKAKQRLEEIKNVTAEFDKAYIPRNNPLLMVATIEELAQSRNIEITIDIRDDVSPTDTAITQIETRIQFTAPLQASLELLNDVSTMPIMFNPTELTIQAPFGTNGNQIPQEIPITVQLTGITYWK